MKRKLTKYKEVEHLTTLFTSRVKFNETDPLGIVWHGNYIAYFEEGRESFGRKHGISYLDIHRSNYTTPIVEATSKYKKPLHYGDSYTIRTSLLDTPAAKMIFNYELYNQKDELVCTGQTEQAFVDENGDLALYCPEFYQKWKEKVQFKNG